MLVLGRAVSRVRRRSALRSSQRPKTSTSTIIQHSRWYSEGPVHKEPVPEVIRYNGRIQDFRKRLDYPKAIEEYQKMLQARVRPDAVTFNLMIQIMGRIKRPDKAQQFFDLMERHSITPNTLHYNALLNAYCAVGNMTEAENLLRDMRAKFVPRDQATYTIMIKTYASAKRFSDAEHHYKLFMDQVKYGQKPNQPEGSKRLALDEVLAGVMIGVYLAQGKVTEAQALLNQILDFGLTSRADAVNTFLSAMLSRPEKNVQADALAFLEDLKQTRGFKPDVVTYHAVLSYWLGVYEKHVTRGAADDVCASAAAAFMNTSSAMLEDSNISVPDYVFATLIRFAAARHDLNLLETIEEEMRRRHIPRTILVSNTLLDFWVQYPGDRGVDIHAKLNSIVFDLKRYKLKPTTITYNILLGFYASKNNVAAVTKLFSEVVESNLRPDSTTYSTLLEVLRDQPAQAQTVIAEIESSGIPFDEKLYIALLKSHSILPIKKLERYLKELLDRGVRPNIPSDDISEIAEKVLYAYIMRAHHVLGRPLFDDPAPAPFAEKHEEPVEEVETKKKTKKKLSSSNKNSKKTKKKVEEEDDEIEFNEEDLSEADLINDEDLKALEGFSSAPKSVSKEQIKEQLTIAQTRAMSLYTRLRTYGIGLGPRFYKSMIPLFRNELPTCLAIAQDVFQRTHKKRTHFVVAQLMLPVIKEETVLFDSDINEWTQRLEQLARESPNPAYPIMDSDSKTAFVAFLDKIHISFKPAESASYSATFNELETRL
eukprot:TRINITY_DN13313_c0_g1_i1.p1 TRINITY_DN13313_c0_g1~~TRINITY_DN13313_c0_g1_i1.p1  ORF type:complete len:766 (+),score=122.71 TRINITY_DN13313_c0_g1_i1:45-2342(+)